MGEGMTSVPDRSAASAIASAFQAVHVLSLASGNKYVPTEQMEPSTKVLCEHLCDASITDKWKNAIRHYTDLKAKALGEQLLNFSEEMAITLSGSPAGGMLLGPGLLPLANECLLRNLGIAADFFGDDATARAMAQAVHKLHDDA